MAVHKTRFPLQEYMKTENRYIKGRVIKVDTMFVNLIQIHHSCKYTKLSNRVSKIYGKVQRIFAKNNEQTKKNAGKKKNTAEFGDLRS